MLRALRILQLNSARKYVGEAAHTLNLTEALRQRGHFVWLGLRKNFETMERAMARKLEPTGFHMPHRWWPPQDARDVHAIAKMVKREKIEIIHAHRGKDHWQAVFAARLYKLDVAIVRTRHVVTPLKNHAANRWLARRTQALIAVSQAVEADVRRSGVYHDSTLAFIPGGIDLSLFNPPTRERRENARAALGLYPDAPVAACVARFATVKAHGVLLDAWKIVRQHQPRAMLLLVGAGRHFEASKLRAKALGIAEGVQFLGKRFDVPQILDAADMGVLASIGSEGFSRAVLEYMASALPTAATRVGAIPDLIDEGVNGRMCAPNDARALAEAVLSIFNASSGQRRQWGRAAFEKVEASYNYCTWAAAHEQLYSELLEAPTDELFE